MLLETMSAKKLIELIEKNDLGIEFNSELKEFAVVVPYEIKGFKGFDFCISKSLSESFLMAIEKYGLAK